MSGGPASVPHRWPGHPYAGAMGSLRIRRRCRYRAVACMAAVTALLLISSCGLLQDRAAGVVEHAIEDAVEGLDLTDGLPQGFPADDVPLIDGPAKGATKTDSDGQVKMVVLVSADDAGEEARDLLTDSGLQIDQTVSTDVGILAQLSGPDRQVTLIASQSQVVYVLTPV